MTDQNLNPKSIHGFLSAFDPLYQEKIAKTQVNSWMTREKFVNVSSKTPDRESESMPINGHISQTK